MKAISSKTFSVFVQSLKQGVLDGYASCAKAENKNGFFSAVLNKSVDSAYVSAVSKIKEDECNAFRITFFVEGLSHGIYAEGDVLGEWLDNNNVKKEDLRMVTSKEDALKALEEISEISQKTGQYDPSEISITLADKDGNTLATLTNDGFIKPKFVDFTDEERKILKESEEEAENKPIQKLFEVAVEKGKEAEPAGKMAGTSKRTRRGKSQ